jgi:hypothetical protein
VLAQQADGLLISDLGESGRATVVLQERLDQAAAAGPAALLAVWREGLAAIAAVHVRGQHLSQAFDRNLVQCPDGVIGYIDFEDDPAEVMTLAECQARDWLSYLHSTAMMLEAAAPQAAGQHWHAALAGVSDEVRERIANAARRMKWAQKLPASRRWGRDTQRVRAVARLLGQLAPGLSPAYANSEKQADPAIFPPAIAPTVAASTACTTTPWRSQTFAHGEHRLSLLISSARCATARSMKTWSSGSLHTHGARGGVSSSRCTRASKAASTLAASICRCASRFAMSG